MYPPFTSDEVAQVEREVVAALSGGVPYPLDVTGHSPGEVVKVVVRGEYPLTEVCFIVRGAIGNDAVGFAYRLWDDPGDPEAPYEWFDTLDDCVDDHIMMATSLRDEAIGTTARHELAPADEHGVHWL